jgi:hypothetical protein
MKKTGLIIVIFYFLSIMVNLSSLTAQEKIGWLSEYATEIDAGSYTCVYNYTAVDNNECKIRIEELKTDKKGRSSSEAYIFYLSDINPLSLSFKASGKVINLSMETNLSQKFITVFEENEFDGYENEISIQMSEVDKARAFIETFKSHIGTCKTTDRSWTSHEEALAWLSENIGESVISSTTYKQAFSKGAKNYLAQLETETTDSKGNRQKEIKTFDLSDIDPSDLSLNVSGKELVVELNVRDNEYYIKVEEDDGEFNFAREVEIHTDDIEIARNIVNAFVFLASDIRPERKEWKSYTQALTYVKDNLKEVSVGSANYSQSLVFGESPSDIVSFTSVKTDSKGASAEETSSFYLHDLNPSVGLDVSSSNGYLDIETKNKDKYIKQSSEGKIQTYSNSLKIYIDDIEMARELINALEYAVKNSESGIKEFASADKAMDWLSQGSGEVTIDDESIQQTLKISPGMENKLDLHVLTTDEGNPPVDERFEIYPEDLALEDLIIKVSGKKLYVPLSTGKLKYIKAYKENELQNFTSGTDVFFEDVQKANNFIAAITTLHENSKVKDRLLADKAAAWDYFNKYLKKLEIGGDTYDQKIEKLEGDDCKLKFTRVETDSKGSTEYIFEFMASDIDPAESDISVYSDKLYITPVTKGKQKLVKTYKNGEVGNFVYDFDLYVDDVLVAKKMLGAVLTLSNACK